MLLKDQFFKKIRLRRYRKVAGNTLKLVFKICLRRYREVAGNTLKLILRAILTFLGAFKRPIFQKKLPLAVSGAVI